MAEALFQVEATNSFVERLESIQDFLAQAGAGHAYDALLAKLRSTVIPNLRRFPRLGRPYLAHPPQSAEALDQLARLPAGSASALREYLTGDYLILYALGEEQHIVWLLSIRHHRQLSFDFARLWPGD